MFKVPLLIRPRGAIAAVARMALSSLILVLVVLSASACRTLPPLPPVDLHSSDWETLQGQAVWRKNRHAPELAGELLVARRPGHILVQFSKSPFTILSAQQTASSWEVQVPMRRERHAGPGSAPKQIAWLQLPHLLHGGSPRPPWVWQRDQNTNGNWRLANPRTGELLEGYLLDESGAP